MFAALIADAVAVDELERGDAGERGDVLQAGVSDFVAAGEIKERDAEELGQMLHSIIRDARTSRQIHRAKLKRVVRNDFENSIIQ